MMLTICLIPQMSPVRNRTLKKHPFTSTDINTVAQHDYNPHHTHTGLLYRQSLGTTQIILFSHRSYSQRTPDIHTIRINITPGFTRPYTRNTPLFNKHYSRDNYCHNDNNHITSVSPTQYHNNCHNRACHFEPHVCNPSRLSWNPCMVHQ